MKEWKKYKEISHNWFYAWLLFTLFGIVTGLFLNWVGNEENEIELMGCMMGFVCYGFGKFIMGIQEWTVQYDIALSMGETRKNYIRTQMIFGTVINILVYLFFALIYKVEAAVYSMCYPQFVINNEVELAIFRPYVIILVLLGLMTLPMAFGALLERLGQKALWFLILFAWLPSIIMSIRKYAVKYLSIGLSSTVYKCLTVGAILLLELICLIFALKTLSKKRVQL